MAMELAMEDDVYFADLNRQISLLIDEDDEHVSRFASRTSQEYRHQRMLVHPPIMPSQYELYEANCRRAEIISKGTGVFITQSSQPRRRYKQQGKRASSASSFAAKTSKNKQVTNSRGRSNIAAHTNTPSYPTNITQY